MAKVGPSGVPQDYEGGLADWVDYPDEYCPGWADAVSNESSDTGAVMPAGTETPVTVPPRGALGKIVDAAAGAPGGPVAKTALALVAIATGWYTAKAMDKKS